MHINFLERNTKGQSVLKHMTRLGNIMKEIQIMIILLIPRKNPGGAQNRLINRQKKTGVDTLDIQNQLIKTFGDIMKKSFGKIMKEEKKKPSKLMRLKNLR